MRSRSLIRYGLVPLVLASVISLPLVLDAQSPRARRQAEAGFGFFQAGFIGLDLADLNSALTAAGYPSFDEQMLTLGGGGFGERGRWLIGGEGHAMAGRDKATADGAFELGLNGGYGMFRIGYKIFTRANVDVYPMFGIGGGGMQLDFRGRSAPTFDDVLADPARSSRLATGGFILDVGAGANYRIRMGAGSDSTEGGMLIGMSAGYTFSPASGDWSLDGINTVAGGPSLTIEGFYVRLSLGGWGRKPARN